MAPDGKALREQVARNGAEGQLLARVDERLGYVIKGQDEASNERSAIVADVGEIKIAQAACAATQVANWKAQDDTNKDLRQKKNLGDAIVAVGAAIGAAAAAAWGKS